MLTMPSVEAQNNFGVLRDYIDAQLAIQAEAEGFASDAETARFLATLRDA